MFIFNAAKESDMHVNHVQLDDDAARLAREDPSTAPEVNSASSVSLDDIMSIDHAVQLTIADMPNALKLLENS